MVFSWSSNFRGYSSTNLFCKRKCIKSITASWEDRVGGRSIISFFGNLQKKDKKVTVGGGGLTKKDLCKCLLGSFLSKKCIEG